jgi:hypothetical protein
MVHSLEFEFLDDAQGGPFVAFGGPIGQLRGLLARNDRLYRLFSTNLAEGVRTLSTLR